MLWSTIGLEEIAIIIIIAPVAVFYLYSFVKMDAYYRD